MGGRDRTGWRSAQPVPESGGALWILGYSGESYLYFDVYLAGTTSRCGFIMMCFYCGTSIFALSQESQELTFGKKNIG